jgi:hypothetical protein
MRASRIASLVVGASLLIACATGGDAIDDGQPGLAGEGEAGTAAGTDGGATRGGSGSSSGSSSGSTSGSSSGSSSGGGGDASSPVDSGSGDDSATAPDSGLGGDASGGGGSSGGGADGGIPPTFCGSNPNYYVEALAAYTGGSPTLCFTSSDCTAGECCFQATSQVPVNVCIMQ